MQKYTHTQTYTLIHAQTNTERETHTHTHTHTESRNNHTKQNNKITLSTTNTVSHLTAQAHCGCGVSSAGLKPPVSLLDIPWFRREVSEPGRPATWEGMHLLCSESIGSFSTVCNYTSWSIVHPCKRENNSDQAISTHYYYHVKKKHCFLCNFFFHPYVRPQ